MSYDGVYEGDIVIFNNTDKLSTSDARSILENGIPYIVTELGYSEGSFFIQVYGRDIFLRDTDMKYIEHIKIAKRHNYKINDYVNLKNISKLFEVEKNGFSSTEDYKITKVLKDNSIVITNGETEMWIKANELPYTEIKKNKSLTKISREDEDYDIQALIDKALDERDFKTLEKLHDKI